MSFHLCGLLTNLSPKETNELAVNSVFEKHPKIATSVRGFLIDGNHYKQILGRTMCSELTAQQTRVLMKTSWRCLEDAFVFAFRRHLQDVLIKTGIELPSRKIKKNLIFSQKKNFLYLGNGAPKNLNNYFHAVNKTLLYSW